MDRSIHLSIGRHWRPEHRKSLTSKKVGIECCVFISGCEKCDLLCRKIRNTIYKPEIS